MKNRCLVNGLLAICLITMTALLISCGSGGGGGGGAAVATNNLTGTVFNSLGSPVAGATVSVFSALSEQTTDANGQFSFNVSSTVHTVQVSRAGSIDTVQVVDLSGGASEDLSLLLRSSDSVPVSVLAANGDLWSSPTVNGIAATLDLPAQASGSFKVGTESGLGSADIALEIIDLNYPLPVPLPSPDTLAAVDLILGGKQAPSVLVSVSPAGLDLDTAATLSIPNPDSLPAGTRILRFDPDIHLWEDTGTVVDGTPVDGTDLAITMGGYYGIFYETDRTTAVDGTGTAGSIIFLSDSAYEVPADGQIYIPKVHIPASGALDVVTYDPAGDSTSTSSVTPVAGTVSSIQVDVGVSAKSVTLGLSQTSVKSDNSNSTTITATVLDKNNAVMEGMDVTFSTSGGQLSQTVVTTDVSGQAQVTFSSGTADRSNQVVTISSSVTGLEPATIPVQVTGTTLAADPTGTTNLSVGDPADTLSISAKDAGGTEIFNAPVVLDVDPEGIVTLSQYTGNTDVTGELAVDVTPVGAGQATVTVTALGTTLTKSYVVGAVGEVFAIISPADNPSSLSTGTDLTVTVSAPGVTDVVFATTLGTWDGGASKVVQKTVAGGQASAVLNSPLAGVATVQATDADDAQTTDSVQVAISAPQSEASQISLQASATVVAVTTGAVANTVTLTATVKNAGDQVVGGAPVAFSILNPTGGGETISPVYVLTNDIGVASTTFRSGSLSSGGSGVNIEASVVGMPAVTPSILPIVIGGTATSVTIGTSTTIESIMEDTTYRLPMSVIVTDSNGNPIPGAEVSLRVSPSDYATGFWEEVAPDECTPTALRVETASEDDNLNNILDPGEDDNLDGQLTPPSSAAGSLPATVETDENGVGNFNLVYVKESAGWIKAQVVASTQVLGTETRSTYGFWLPYLEADDCQLPDSPYN